MRLAHEPDMNEQEQARVALAEINHAIAQSGGDLTSMTVRIAGTGETVVLPRSVIHLLLDLLANLAGGHAVTIIPAKAELTTQQAADMLNVSRPHLVKLLTDGTIPYRQVGTHRRVSAEDLERYRRKQEIETRKAADKLVELDQELGLY